MATWKGYKRKCVNTDGSVFYHTKWVYEESQTMNKYELQFPNVYHREDKMNDVQDDFSTRIKDMGEEQTQRTPTVKSVLIRERTIVKGLS